VQTLLPTETEVARRCPECGAPVEPPDGLPNYEYGVGAVGYQGCDECGSRWRCLWHEFDPPTVRSGRLGTILRVTVAVALAGATLAGVAVYAQSHATSRLRPVAALPVVARHEAPPRPAAGDDTNAATSTDFRHAFGPESAVRSRLMQWLADAQSSAQVDVDVQVSGYQQVAREAEHALRAARWPQAAAADVANLGRADASFAAELDELHYGLVYSPSFMTQLASDNDALTRDVTLVQRDLAATPAR